MRSDSVVRERPAVRLAAVGEVCGDHDIGTGTWRLGGISMNFARVAASLGADVALWAALGDDALGDRLASAAQQAGLAELHLQRRQGASPSQKLRISARGEREFCGFDPGASTQLTLTQEDRERLRRYTGVHVPYSPEQASLVKEVRAFVKGSSCSLMVDFSIDSLADRQNPEREIACELDGVSIAFFGGDEAHLPAMQALAAAHDAVIVLTAGARGAWAVGNETWHAPSVTERIVDTTGCGDAFQAGFAVAWLRGEGAEAALRAGADAARTAAGHFGGGPKEFALVFDGIGTL